METIRWAGDRSIQIHLDCAGGDSQGALQIAVALLAHPFAVHCRIAGRCSSAATFLAMAADTRSIAESGSVLVHAACRIFVPEQFNNYRRLPLSEKQAVIDSLSDLDDAQTALLCTRLGVPEEMARAWLVEDRKWSAMESLERGFVQSVDADAGAQ